MRLHYPTFILNGPSNTHSCQFTSKISLHAIGRVVIFRGLLDPTGRQPPVSLPRKPLTSFWGMGFTRQEYRLCRYTSCSAFWKSQVPSLRHSNTSRRYSLASPSISVILTSIQNLCLSHRGDVHSTSLDVRGDFGRLRLPRV